MKTLLALVLLAAALQGQTTPVELARRAGPAVVTIKTASPSGGSTASGFIVDASGTIVTNLHVVQGATAIAVKLPNGDVYDQVRIRAFDARKDLAVLQIAGFGLPTVEIGNSDAVQPGQPVVLIGDPLGVLQESVSTGVVSGVRQLEEAGFRVIQTDAAANPGSSGGPLLDGDGKVIGVLSVKLVGTENLTVVIPINYARGLLASTDSFGLGELEKRLSGSSADLFGATGTTFGTRWKSLFSGTTNILRRDGDRVYVETVVSAEAKAAGAFGIAELSKTGDKYVGTVRQARPCEWDNWTSGQNLCKLEDPVEITLLTPTRIEGAAMVYPKDAAFDCKKCQYKKKGVMTPFVWIPE
jgi:S1-C subfamily serine protease